MSEGFLLAEFILDGDGRPYDIQLLEMNPAFGRLIGVAPGAAKSRTVLELFPNADPQWIETFAGVAFTGEPISFVKYSPSLNKWFKVHAFSPGKTKFACFFMDITEQKLGELALERYKAELEIRNRIDLIFLTRTDEQMYGDVLEVLMEVMESRYGVFGYIDETGAYVCPSMTRAIWSECQMAQKTIYFPRESWGEDALWAKSLIQKGPLFMNRPGKVPEGHVDIQRALTVPIVHQGDLIGLFILANKAADYTEEDVRKVEAIASYIAPVLDARLRKDFQERRRKEAEEALRESEERFRIMADGTPMIIWVTDAEGRIQFVNRAYCKFFGTTLEAVQSRGWQQLVHPEDAPGYVGAYFDSLWNRTPFRAQARVRRHDGEWRWVESYGEPRFSASGEFLGIAGSSPDITERMRSEQAVEKARDELEMRVRERTKELESEIEHRKRMEQTLRKSEKQLRYLSRKLLSVQEEERRRLAGEVHDSFGASLSAVKYKIESVLKEKGNNEKLRDCAAHLHQAMDDCRRIQMALRPSILDDIGLMAGLNWFCREFRRTYSHIEVKTQLRVEEHEVPESLKIVIFRIAQEAFSNIAKHSKAASVDLFLDRTDSSLNLNIQDNGVGFGTEVIEGRNAEQRGLGLSSMEERASLSGGAFSIHSSAGRGTLVRVSWPVK
jgi:PAS domain S-box-containing protein